MYCFDVFKRENAKECGEMQIQMVEVAGTVQLQGPQRTETGMWKTKWTCVDLSPGM